ncbi:MAG: class I SAM-dependent methyltransferase [Acidimicrobiales bacterium]
MSGNLNLDLLPPPAGSTLLDVGCAGGETTLGLQRAGYRMAAIESDPELVDALRRKPGARDVDIRHGDATAMPFADQSFDGVVLIEVIEHVHDTGTLLAEIGRVVKPAGRLCVALPTAYTEHVYWRLNPEYARNATHVTIFSLGQLRRHLDRAGFDIMAIETKNLLPAVSWFFHALLRSRSDHTGTIFDHLWVDRFLTRVYERMERTPFVSHVVTAVGGVFGKSWYVYCEKRA